MFIISLKEKLVANWCHIKFDPETQTISLIIKRNLVKSSLKTRGFLETDDIISGNVWELNPLTSTIAEAIQF